MFKLVVLSALLAVAAAHVVAPVAYTVAETPVIAKVGAIVENVPTAVSHQSSTVVHSRAAVSTPIVAPVVEKTIVAAAPAPLANPAPAPLAFAAPIKYVGHSAPYATKTVITGPGGPVVYEKAVLEGTGPVAYTAPLAYSAPAVKYVSSPLVYSAPNIVKGW